MAADDKKRSSLLAASSWRMHGENAPLFAEYLGLAAESGWEDLLHRGDATIGPEDALIVVDMQNDFVPADGVINQEGGAFAVAEGDGIAPLIVNLMNHFVDQGGMVAATRDYHPKDHCSFIEHNGPFPAHCVQGSVGSHFYKPIGNCIENLRRRKGSDRVEIVFKGFHTDVDSFGSFEYKDASYKGRCPFRDTEEHCYGCALEFWTGSCVLNCSCSSTDVNAPPDVMAVYGRVSLADWLRNKGAKRVFACGLALDFCVLDTVLNGLKSGFDPGNVFMILDAARAAYIPGVGQIGSGFLQDPVELKEKMTAAGARLIPAVAVLPQMFSLTVVNAISIAEVGIRCFPNTLGPYALVMAEDLVLRLDRENNKYTVEAPSDLIESLKLHTIDLTGVVCPVSPVTLDADAKRIAGIPECAVEFAWVFPLGQGNFQDQTHAYFSITSPGAAFCVHGGFIYLDEKGEIVRVMARSLGEGLTFESPQPWLPEFTSSLAGRWHPARMRAYRRASAKLYTWINPGEELKSSDGGKAWTAPEHGAFAFLFNEDIAQPDERDIVFALSARPAQMALQHLGRCYTEGVKSQNQVNSLPEVGQGMVRAFRRWDATGNGRIEESRLLKVMAELCPFMAEKDVKDVTKELLDNGEVNYIEFVKWLFK